jgi:hypothetical protein
MACNNPNTGVDFLNPGSLKIGASERAYGGIEMRFHLILKMGGKAGDGDGSDLGELIASEILSYFLAFWTGYSR